MESTFGDVLRVTLFGESHGPEIGVIVEGFPAGMRVDFAQLKDFLERRAPGRNAYSTPRREDDEPEFLSGVADGVTLGTAIKNIVKFIYHRCYFECSIIICAFPLGLSFIEICKHCLKTRIQNRKFIHFFSKFDK